MNWLKNFLKPRQSNFVRLLIQQAEYAVWGMDALEKYMKKRSPKHAEQVRTMEKEADEVRRILIDELNRTFVTPIDREDIHALSRAIDDVLDYGYATIGEMEILEFYAAHDVGRAINPTACEGQLEGSVAQGMGYGLLEQVEHKDGVMLNPGFSNYRVPTAMDVPRISTALIEPIDPAGPFGAKGVAEPGMTPTAACIANAIYDAVGVRIKELPITPEKIWKALRDQEQKP